MKTPLISPSDPRRWERQTYPSRRLFSQSPAAVDEKYQVAGWRIVDKLLIESSPDSVGLIGAVARDHRLAVGPALSRVIQAASALGAPGNEQQEQFEKVVKAGREEIISGLNAARPENARPGP